MITDLFLKKVCQDEGQLSYSAISLSVLMPSNVGFWRRLRKIWRCNYYSFIFYSNPLMLICFLVVFPYFSSYTINLLKMEKALCYERRQWYSLNYLSFRFLLADSKKIVLLNWLQASRWGNTDILNSSRCFNI